MKFRTELNNIKASKRIAYADKILCIGSCFAENLHLHLKRLKYTTFLNPCGITYNPISILKSLKYASGELSISMDEINEVNGIYSHPDFHSEFSATSRIGAHDKIKAQLEESFPFAKADVFIISLGTAFVYEDLVSKNIVNNCHKIPAKNFSKRLLNQEEVFDSLNKSIEIIRKKNPRAKVIATVSPVRHLRDGMVNNTRSKATLHLALSSIGDIDYFPSYELLIDDLRDYRFYSKDLLHPSEEAISYILEFFTNNFLEAKEAGLRKRISQLHKDLEHRSFFPQSAENQEFLRKLIIKMEDLSLEGFDFTAEMASTKAKLG